MVPVKRGAFTPLTIGSDSQKFHFAAPKHQPRSDCFSRFSIDYESAPVVHIADTIEKPWLLKTLSLGTWGDVELMERIRSAFPKTLAEVWKEWDPKMEQTGRGFDLSPRLQQFETDYLPKLPVFERPTGASSIRNLNFQIFEKKYGTKGALRPRNEKLYQPTLIIVPENPGDDPRMPKAFIGTRPLAFNKSNYGYSTAGHQHEATLAALIYLLAHSALFRYFCLMTSVRIGADRQTFNKNEFDALPFPRVEELSASERSRIEKLAEQLELAEIKPWDELDAFLFKLYNLNDRDVQQARDTLFASASYRHAGREALQPPTSPIRAAFAKRLKDFLQPFFEVCGESLSVAEPSFQQDIYRKSWFFLVLRKSDASEKGSAVPSELLVAAMAQANESGSSRVIIRLPGKNGLLLGLLSQQRWWTQSRAILCGQHLLRHHLDAFGIDKEVSDQ